VETTSGTTPMMKAKEVIRIGRTASYRFHPPLTGFGSTRLMAAHSESVSSYRMIQVSP
jgi:hypothetical protein